MSKINTQKLSILFLILISMLLVNPAFAALPMHFNLLEQHTLAPIINQTKTSVVFISGLKKIKNIHYKDHTLEDQISVTFGSGIIIDKDKGYILTNAHVVEELDEIMVSLNDKRKFPAKLLGSDQASDLALIEIKAENLTEITFADSDKAQVGDFVIAIGNPYNLTQTVTSGIISALSRTNVGVEDGFYDFIQTDAAINVGNSGGPLINLKGELIGINTAIISPNNGVGGNLGLGLAIPSNMARGISNQLSLHGKVDRGPLGVRVQDLDPALATAFATNSNEGAVIIEVIPNTPAEAAELEIGDVIVKVNNKNIKDASHLRTMISMIPPGSKAIIEAIRNKKSMIKVAKIINPKDRYIKGEEIFSGLEGAFLEAMTHSSSDISGLKVTDIKENSKVYTSKLLIGDIIITANAIKTHDKESLKSAAQKNNNVMLLQVSRDGINFFVALLK